MKDSILCQPVLSKQELSSVCSEERRKETEIEDKQAGRKGEVRPQEGAKTMASTPYLSKPVQHN